MQLSVISPYFSISMQTLPRSLSRCFLNFLRTCVFFPNCVVITLLDRSLISTSTILLSCIPDPLFFIPPCIPFLILLFSIVVESYVTSLPFAFRMFRFACYTVFQNILFLYRYCSPFFELCLFVASSLILIAYRIFPLSFVIIFCAQITVFIGFLLL